MGSENGFPKYPSIKRIGHRSNDGVLEQGKIVVKEKLDGANFRFTYDPEDDRLVFGSRNVEWWNETDTDRAFQHAVDHVRGQMGNVEERNKAGVVTDINTPSGTFVSVATDHGLDPRNIVVYGESMHAHTLDYGQSVQHGDATVWEDVPSFIGFDVYNVEAEQFVDWQTTQVFFADCELTSVPTVYEGPARQFDLPPSDDMVESEYRDGPAEGIVIRNTETGQVAKHRSEKFLERHKGSNSTEPDDYNPSDSINLARQFTTEARVLKQIHKYEDQGRSVDSMEVMDDLWYDVFDDIIVEEADTIFLGNYTIETKAFRSEVASITVDILRSYLERSDGSVLDQPAGDGE